MKWKDITSYTRSDADRKPHTWEAQINDHIRVVVLDNHRDYPGQWVFHCDAVGYDTQPLGEELVLKHAQRRALVTVRARLAAWLQDVVKASVLERREKEATNG